MVTEKAIERSAPRPVSKDKYIIAGVITFLIFSLGLTLGSIIQDHRYNLVEEVNMEQDVKYLSLQLQYLYLNSYSNIDSCPILSTTLKETIKDLSESLSEVVSYEEESKSTDKRKEVVMRRYVIDNIRYWLLAKQSKEKCKLNIIPIIYFYATECSSCPNQGTILTYYKNIFGDQVLVFPINLDLKNEETMVEILMAQFNVTKYPTLIIDDQKYEGVVDKESMGKLICQSLKDAPQCKEILEAQ